MKVLQGAGVGAILGGAVAGVAHVMQRHAQPADLQSEHVHALRNDAELVGVLALFTPLRLASRECASLYDSMIANCELLLDAEQRKVRGAEQLRVTRAAAQVTAAAKALCREAAKTPSTSETAFECMREIEGLETLVGNHLHNVMLEG